MMMGGSRNRKKMSGVRVVGCNYDILSGWSAAIIIITECVMLCYSIIIYAGKIKVAYSELVGSV